MRLPQVDKILRHPILIARESEIRHECLANLVRQVLHRLRHSADEKNSGDKRDDKVAQPSHTEESIAVEVSSLVDELLACSLQKVINGTGVILSTNLGRAPLPGSLVEKLTQILPGYSSLEIDLESGTRGERAHAVERLLTILTGCESAIVVNNCAAAVLLMVNALAPGKEVIVSRGELIEIGGSFRLPDVIVAGGAILKEVGTTNRTRTSDYEKAIGDNTALLLKCHRSNFEITGFTEEASVEELKSLAKAKGIPLIEDLGSGAMIDLTSLGLKHERTVQESVKSTDVVMFSGDKLLGGSQAGMIVGRSDLIKKMRTHPTYRAVRLDKLNISLLELTLAEYLKSTIVETMPVYRMAALSGDVLQKRAREFVERIGSRLHHLRCTTVPAKSAFGGGTLPNQTIESYGIQIGIAAGGASKMSSGKIAACLRNHRPAIVPLTSADCVVIDLRTVAPSEETDIERALIEIDRSLS